MHSSAENDREDRWAAFIKKNHMTWPQFLDKTRKMVPPFGITGYPTCILIDGGGIVRWRSSGCGMDFVLPKFVSPACGSQKS